MKDFEDDLTFARLVCTGCETAAAELYRKYYSYVTATCVRILKNSPDAEDVVQETFIQIFRKLHLYKRDAALRTWIYRLATNQCFMHLRHRRQKNGRKTDSGDDALKFLPASGCSNPEKAIDRIIFEKAFSALPDGYAKVLILHDAFGLEHREIAEALGVAEGTSKSQLHKARKKMRQQINRTGNLKRRQSAAKIRPMVAQLINDVVCENAPTWEVLANI